MLQERFEKASLKQNNKDIINDNHKIVSNKYSIVGMVLLVRQAPNLDSKEI